MREPAADELAAITATYALLAGLPEAPPAGAVSRWRLAGRAYAQHERLAARAASRWKAAARSSNDRV
jgi:hypothetical protein